MLPWQPPPLAIEESGKGGKQRKKRGKQQRSLGTLLGQDESLLFSGAHSGELDCCYEALSAGVDVNVRTKADLDGVGTGSTALHVAAARGHEDVAVVLLKAGADPNMVSGRGELPIQLATRSGHVGVVRALSTVSVPTQNAEGVMQLLSSAPRHAGDSAKRKMHSALAGKGAHRRLREPMPDMLRRSDGTQGVWDEPDDHDQGAVGVVDAYWPQPALTDGAASSRAPSARSRSPRSLPPAPPAPPAPLPPPPPTTRGDQASAAPGAVNVEEHAQPSSQPRRPQQGQPHGGCAPPGQGGGAKGGAKGTRRSKGAGKGGKGARK